MAGGFYITDGVANNQAYGQNTGTSFITTVTSTGTNTKGSYVQLTASTSSDITHIAVNQSGSGMGGAAQALDIAIGASGSEKIVLNNIIAVGLSPICVMSPLFPVCIPAGSRIAVRSQTSNSADNGNCALVCFDDGSMGRAGGVVESVGFLTASTLGTAIDPGATANTKGTYVAITASTSVDYSGFCFALDCQGTNYASSANSLVDVAVGAGGSEKIIINNYPCRLCSGGILNPQWSPWFDMPIPSGTRIAVRSQCSSNTSTNRIIGFTFYGLR